MHLLHCPAYSTSRSVIFLVFGGTRLNVGHLRHVSIDMYGGGTDATTIVNGVKSVISNVSLTVP